MSKKKDTANAQDEEQSPQDETVVDEQVSQEGDPILRALELRLEEAEAKAQENWDKLLRTQAESDNLRRRTERELENAHKYALERFAQELLPVKDSMEMGLSVAGAEEADVAKLREGAELTLKMLETAMDKFGIKELHPQDEPFNPELHQAMSMLEAPDKAPNTVIDVMQKGYTLNERLIRPAMVVVSKAAAQEAPKADQDSESEEAGSKETLGNNIDEQA